MVGKDQAAVQTAGKNADELPIGAMKNCSPGVRTFGYVVAATLVFVGIFNVMGNLQTTAEEIGE